MVIINGFWQKHLIIPKKDLDSSRTENILSDVDDECYQMDILVPIKINICFFSFDLLMGGLDGWIS